MEKYVCLPEYDCACYPRGKAVSRNTMLNHRRAANNRLVSQGLEPNIPWGPQESRSEVIREQYESLAHEISLSSEEKPGSVFAHTEEYAFTSDSSDESSGQHRVLYESSTPSDQIEKIDEGLPLVDVSGDNSMDLSGYMETELDEHAQADVGSLTDGFVPHNETSCAENLIHISADQTSDHSHSEARQELVNTDEATGPAFDTDWVTWDEVDYEDNAGESALVITDGHHTDISTSDSDQSEEYELSSNASLVVDTSTEFRSWASKNEAWINLFYNNALSQKTMNEALALLSCPYKSWKTITARMKEESGMSTVVTEYPICPGHMCFHSENIPCCSICGRDRPLSSTSNAPKIQWMRLPPRLQAWFLDKKRCDQLYDYINTTDAESGQLLRDFYDSEAYRRIRDQYGGDDEIADDIFISVSTDGFQAFKNKSYDVWPIAAIVLNLPPHLRFCVKNVVPFAFIPGPSEPLDLQSFFEPLLAEIEQISEGGGLEFEFYDGHKRRIRVHVLWFTGDLPAVKKMAGLKGHNGKFPCRYCWVEGIWSDVFRHNYFPLFVREGGVVRQRYQHENIMPPLRTVEESLEIIAELSSRSGRQKSEMQVTTGIVQGSNFFRLPNILPYHSFPIDVMHLFYNIGKDMLRLWCDGDGEDYWLSRNAKQQIDTELQAFGDGIASDIGSRPRPISKYKDWKSAEVKAFILDYSLVVLDGHLPEQFLSGWESFVVLADICWRPVITVEDLEKVETLGLDFCRHYEKYYYRVDEERLNYCKYIGWVVGRLKAKKLAAASLFRNALFGEVYKTYYKSPFIDEETDYAFVEAQGGFLFRGKSHIHWLSYEKDSDLRLLDRLRSYFRRKYDGMTVAEANDILEKVDHCNLRQRLQFLNGSGTQSASVYFDIGAWEEEQVITTKRASWFVACEMEDASKKEIYYGRVLKFIEFEVSCNLEEKWPHWQMKYDVALMDWATGLEVGKNGQVYKNCPSSTAFSAATVEDVSIIRRLISVVDHIVPSRNGVLRVAGSRSTSIRGRKRCYFLDDRMRSDRLLEPDAKCADGFNRSLCGRRGG